MKANSYTTSIRPRTIRKRKLNIEEEQSVVVLSWVKRSPWEQEPSAQDCWAASEPQRQVAVFRQGDAALLRFPAALELLEADFWIQYNELGGIQDDEVPGGSGNEAYTDALELIEDEMEDYIHDNTDDEITHHQFLNAYLVSKGAAPANLDAFRTLMGSTATGVNPDKIGTSAHEPDATYDRYQLVDALSRRQA